jgi:hypothetical protein
MKSTKIIKACRGSRAVRIAAGLVVIAAAAAGVGLAPGGAGATNGWGRPPQTVVQPAQPTPARPAGPFSSPSDQAVTSSNGWG